MRAASSYYGSQEEPEALYPRPRSSFVAYNLQLSQSKRESLGSGLSEDMAASQTESHARQRTDRARADSRLDEEDSAARIQARVRGRRAERAVDEHRRLRQEAEEYDSLLTEVAEQRAAATKLQALERGRLARRAENASPDHDSLPLSPHAAACRAMGAVDAQSVSQRYAWNSELTQAEAAAEEAAHATAAAERAVERAIGRGTEQERLRVAARKLADGIPLSEAELRATKAALLSDWPGEGGGATEERSFREQEAQLGADRDAFYGFGASPARHSASPARHGASRFTEPSWSSSWVDASPAPFASGGGVRMPGSRPTPPSGGASSATKPACADSSPRLQSSYPGLQSYGEDDGEHASGASYAAPQSYARSSLSSPKKPPTKPPPPPPMRGAMPAEPLSAEAARARRGAHGHEDEEFESVAAELHARVADGYMLTRAERSLLLSAAAEAADSMRADGRAHARSVRSPHARGSQLAERRRERIGGSSLGRLSPDSLALQARVAEGHMLSTSELRRLRAELASFDEAPGTSLSPDSRAGAARAAPAPSAASGTNRHARRGLYLEQYSNGSMGAKQASALPSVALPALCLIFWGCPLLLPSARPLRALCLPSARCPLPALLLPADSPECPPLSVPDCRLPS